MKIKVLGKAHLKGISKKSGNEYNFYQVHYIGRERNVEGQAACTVNIDPNLVASFESIAIGGEYAVEFGQRGYVVAFDKA